MTEGLNQVDLVSILSSSRNLDPKFSARQAWMIIHEKIPDAYVIKFSEILNSLSTELNPNLTANLPDKPLTNNPIFQFERDERGVRMYSFCIQQEHYTTANVISKIKQVMCHHTADQDSLMTTEIGHTVFSDSQNEFMTITEIAYQTGIKRERVNHIISLLLDLGVLVLESETTLTEILNGTQNFHRKNTCKRVKWDENREARRRNLSDWLQYINRLRKMENELINLNLQQHTE